MIFSKVQFASLNEENSEIVWRGKDDFPSKEFLHQLSLSLPVASSKLTPKGDCLVWRDIRHLSSWASNFVSTEREINNDEFVSEENDYEIIVLKSVNLSEVDILFRLSTRDHPGHTSYRIAWRRLITSTGEDMYICLE